MNDEVPEKGVDTFVGSLEKLKTQCLGNQLTTQEHYFSNACVCDNTYVKNP